MDTATLLPRVQQPVPHLSPPYTTQILPTASHYVSDTLTLSLAVDVTVKYKTFCNLTTKSDGQTYLQPLDYELVLEPKAASCYFSNMFNGNKLLGETHV